MHLAASHLLDHALDVALTLSVVKHTQLDGADALAYVTPEHGALALAAPPDYLAHLRG